MDSCYAHLWESMRITWIRVVYKTRIQLDSPEWRSDLTAELEIIATCPEEICQLIKANTSFTKSLDLNHQGGDFCLEEKIKRHKFVAPKGRVSNETWRQVSRGLDKIEVIYTNGMKMLSLDTNDNYRNIDLYEEIISWRAILRGSEMISNDEDSDEVAKNVLCTTIVIWIRRHNSNT